MKNVIVLNGETYVKVSSIEENGLFTFIHYVYRRKPEEPDYHKGIAFMNLADAEQYKQTLENVLGMYCYIHSESVYTRL